MNFNWILVLIIVVLLFVCVGLWIMVKNLREEKKKAGKEAEEKEKTHESIEFWNVLFTTTATETATSNLGVQKEVTTLEKVVVPVFQQIQGDIKNILDDHKRVMQQERNRRQNDNDDMNVGISSLRQVLGDLNGHKEFRRLSRCFPIVKSDKFQKILEDFENFEERKRLLVERDESDLGNVEDPCIGEKAELLASAITSMLNCIVTIFCASCDKHIDPSKEKEANAKIDKAMKEFQGKNDEVNKKLEEIDKKLQELNQQKQQQVWVPRRSQGYSMER